MKVHSSQAKKPFKPQFFAVTLLKEFFTPHPHAYELSTEQILRTMGRGDKTPAQNKVWLSRRLALLRHHGLIVCISEAGADNALDKVRLTPKGWKMLYDTKYPVEKLQEAAPFGKKNIQDQTADWTSEDKANYIPNGIPEVKWPSVNNTNSTTNLEGNITDKNEPRISPMSKENSSTEQTTAESLNSSKPLSKLPTLDVAEAIALFKKQNPHYEVTFRVTLRSNVTEKYRKS